MILDEAPRGLVLGPERYAVHGLAPRTELGAFLRAQVAQGWWSTIAAQLLTRGERARAEEDDQQVYLTEREWRQSPEWREGLAWEPGLTRGRARFNAAIHDENRVREDVIARRRAGLAGQALGFGAMMLGGLPTPENFIPIGGPAWRAAAILRAGSIGGRALVHAAEAGTVTALASPLVLASQQSFGDDVGAADMLLDIAVGTALGAVLGAGAGAVARWRGRDAGLLGTQRAHMLAAQELDAAAAAIAEGRQPAVDPALTREILRLRGLTEGEVETELAALRRQLAEAERLREQAERGLAAARRQAEAGARLADIGPGVEVEVRAGADSALTARVRYEVVEARDLITSHRDDTFRPDPRFNQALQIRDRDRDAAIQQVRERAARLDPSQLLGSPLASTGAPVVGPDGLVESGNGRVLSIRLAWREGMPGAAAYRDTLRRLGFDVDGLAEPVLIRRRVTELTPDDRVRFADDANRDVIERRSATEEARADARLLTPEVLAQLKPEPLDGAANMAFVRAFIAALPRAEQPAMTTPDGRLATDGLARIERAVQAAAYADRRLVATMLESTDEALARLGRVLRAAAPTVLAWRAAVAEGRVLPQLDGSHDLVAAALLVRDARARGRPLVELLSLPDDMLGQGPSAAARLWLSLMLARRAGGTAAVVAADTLTARIGRAFALAEAAPQATDMFGAPPPTIRTVLATLHAEERVDLPFLPDGIRDHADPPPPPAGAPEPAPAPAAVRGQAVDAPAWTPDRVDAAGRPIWPEDVRAALAAQATARARLAEALGRPDGPEIGTHLIDTAERQRLRAEVVAAVEADRRQAVGELRQERRALVVMGPPAAGKSSLIEPLARRFGALVVDADDIKAKLPEFDRGRGAGLVHEESAALALIMRDRAIARGDALALPIVGSSADRVAGELAALRAAGYHVTLVYNDLPIEKAVERAIRRFRADGRLVDPDYVWSVDERPKQTYLRIRSTVDDHALYSTDVAPGARPRYLGGTRDLLADVPLDAGPGRGAADAVAGGGQATAGRGGRGPGDAGAARQPGGAARQPGGDARPTAGADGDPDLALLADAVDDLARRGRLTDADAAILREGNEAGALAEALAEALHTAAACMVRAA